MGPDGALGVHLPLTPDEPAESSRRRFRIVVEGLFGPPSFRLSLVSRPAGSGRSRDRIDNLEFRRLPDGALASPWVVVVTDPDDRAMENLADRALLVALGDTVEARVRRGGGRASVTSRRVGEEAPGKGELVNLLLPVRVTVMRRGSGGAPVVGGDEEGATRIARYQLEMANRVLSRCHITTGDPSEAVVGVEEAPPPSMIVVGQSNGLHSGGGVFRVRANGRDLGPWKIGEGYTPEETARVIFGRLTEEGFSVVLTMVPRTRSKAAGAADLVVRDQDGAPVRLDRPVDDPLTTDPSQSLEIGAVDLADGLDSYDANSLVSGTVEERVLLETSPGAAARDGRVQVFFVNRFDDPGRQGESFLPGPVAGPGAIVLDARALARARQANTLAHEIGHVLLRDLEHADGDGEGWLLMHSMSSSAVGGPRWITEEECEAMRRFEGLVPLAGAEPAR